MGLAGEPQTDQQGGDAAIRGHVYLTNPETSRGSGGPGIDALGRADLNGTSVEKRFIPDVTIPGAIALDSHHIYWTNTETGAIGRADLDGTHVDQSFISAGGSVGALAVDARHIYWTAGGNTSTPAEIGRASIDGTQIDPSGWTRQFHRRTRRKPTPHLLDQQGRGHDRASGPQWLAHQ